MTAWLFRKKTVNCYRQISPFKTIEKLKQRRQRQLGESHQKQYLNFAVMLNRLAGKMRTSIPGIKLVGRVWMFRENMITVTSST